MAGIQYHFEKLTPVDNINLDIYEEAIDRMHYKFCIIYMDHITGHLLLTTMKKI